MIANVLNNELLYIDFQLYCYMLAWRNARVAWFMESILLSARSPVAIDPSTNGVTSIFWKSGRRRTLTSSSATIDPAVPLTPTQHTPVKTNARTYLLSLFFETVSMNRISCFVLFFLESLNETKSQSTSIAAAIEAADELEAKLHMQREEYRCVFAVSLRVIRVYKCSARNIGACSWCRYSEGVFARRSTTAKGSKYTPIPA